MKSKDAKMFDTFRMIRNAINYYGKRIESFEAKGIMSDLMRLINKYN